MVPGAALLLRCLVHGTWILVPGPSWSCCSDHLVPRIMDHGAIPWVLVALDPGSLVHGS